MSTTDATLTDTIFARVHIEAVTKESFPPEGLADLVKRYGLHTQHQEAFWIIGNDLLGNVRTIIEVARGSGDVVQVDIAATMTAILATGASAFSVAHNHPTMTALPSASDAQLTHDLMEAANVLGLLFEDHVIVEPGGDSFSFRKAKMIVGARRPKATAASRGRR